MRGAQAKAGVLTEALPYIRAWAGKTVVIKAGGETMADPGKLDSFAGDVALLRFVSINPVIVHGGGPQITEAMRLAGRGTSFVNGHRVTDAETMKIVKTVLMERLNAPLVSSLRSHGVKSEGMAGDDGIVEVRRRDEALGFVGEIVRVNAGPLEEMAGSDVVPVIAPLGAGPGGAHNVNADLAAGAIAASLGAQKIVFLTNVAGLYRDLGDEGSLISEIGIDQLRKLLDEGGLSAGMIPKIESAVSAMQGGVPQAHILDGRVEHALLLEIFTDEGIGTMVLG